MTSMGLPPRWVIWPLSALKVVEPLARCWCTKMVFKAPLGVALWA